MSQHTELVMQLRREADQANEIYRYGPRPLDLIEAALQAADTIEALSVNPLTHASTYAAFTDGMKAAAEICGSLAETTYDDSDGFEAATGCEAAIMRVVKQQRKEQKDAALSVNPLREAMERIANGDEPRPLGETWRGDGKPSKHDKCTHGRWMYEDCGNCVAEFARKALGEQQP